MTTREEVYSALFALGQSLRWGGVYTNFAYTGRRVKTFADLPAQPALCQAEHDEGHVQDISMPGMRTWRASWFIYQDVGKNPNAVPAIENNLILDAIDAALPGDTEEWAALGGLAYSCMIDRKNIFKDPGDLDGMGLIIVPIAIIVP